MIYLDNASTSFPKPKEVADNVYKYMTQIGSNINRGCYQNAYSVEETVFDTRMLLCELFDGADCKNVVFTKNVTESINTVLKGFLKAGDHILVSSMEHNCVMRTLTQLQANDISYSLIPCDSDGSIILDAIKPLVTPKTKALICTHASNVCGTVMPIKKIGLICKEIGISFFVDSAQTAGILPISMKDMNIDVLAFTGHKGLLGPQGIGGFILSDGMIDKIIPLVVGGTGSFSDSIDIPKLMPDRFEAGTLNLPGIIGLHASLSWLKQIGIQAVYRHEMALTELFLKGLLGLEEKGLITIVGKRDTTDRLGVVSIQTPNVDLANAAFLLDEKYQIMTRVGQHCAPIAHQTLKTFPTGTLRFSFGYFNTEEDVTTALSALENICHGIKTITVLC